MTSKPNKDDPVAQLMQLVDSYKDAQAQNKYGNLPKIRAAIEEAALGLQSSPAVAIAKDQEQRAKVAKALGLDCRTNWAWSYLRQQIEALKNQVPTQAARDVIEERARQINAKGYEPDADDGYEHGPLAFAAATYAVLATNAPKHTTEHLWPWSLDSLKVGEPRRMLVKAGALIQAAIEREDRAAQAKQGEQANG